MGPNRGARRRNLDCRSSWVGGAAHAEGASGRTESTLPSRLLLHSYAADLEPCGVEKVAIVLHCLWLVNGFALLLTPFAKLKGFYAQVPSWGQPTPAIAFETMLPLMRFGVWAGIITSLVVLYFLITRGWAFRNGSAVNAAAS